jgi:hypothetical protein
MSTLVLTAAACLLAPYAYAHLSGVFAYFVQDIHSPSASTRMLQQQLNDVGKRIADMEPQVEQARAEYGIQADSAVQRIRFYDVYVGSALGALWAGAQDPIDVLASTELMQKRLAEDLEALTVLAESYRVLQGKESELRRFADLLMPFREASAARDFRLSHVPTGLVSPFAEPYIAYRIAEDWEELRGTTFTLYFNWAASRIAELGVGVVLDRLDDAGTAWELKEEALNALVGGDSFPFLKDARFYLRADHMNFSARLVSARNEYNLLTVGQIERTGPFTVQYRIEGIFLDGMPLDPNDPDIQREVYRGQLLGINLTPLMPPLAKVVSFEQRNGNLLFRFQ